MESGDSMNEDNPWQQSRTKMKLKPDANLRKLWYTSEAMCHPAKAHLGMMLEIFERYTQPGDSVLDPMAGIGSTLVGCLMGRDVICVELEEHFVRPMAASWHKIRQHGPMLGCEMGKVLIIWGDARALPLGRADACVFSPPYSEGLGHGVGREGPLDIAKGLHNARGIKSYTRPQAIITSPPYGDSPVGANNVEGTHRRLTDAMAKGVQLSVRAQSYAESGKYRGNFTERPYSADAQNNVGTLRGERYFQAMEQIYRECHRVLVPNGLLVLILKGYTRGGKYVDLPQQTLELVEPLGSKLHDRWQRELYSLSFWRTLQRRRDPQGFDDRLRFEEILAFRKEGP